MKNLISMWQAGVAAGLLLGQLAAVGPRADISTWGFGDAKFGMDIESIACNAKRQVQHTRPQDGVQLQASGSVFRLLTL